MKFKSLAFALLLIPLLATLSHAQNLFRTGRPDYTRDYPATYHDRYAANSYGSNSYGDARLSPNRSPDYDRERLNRAWENYRNEAARYQTRYGGNFSNDYGTTPYNSVRPVNYESDYAPNRRCTSLKPDMLRDRLPSSTATPVGYYNNPSYYGNDYSYGNGFGNRTSGLGTSPYPADPYGTNLNRTASRPFASLIDSLFGTNR